MAATLAGLVLDAFGVFLPARRMLAGETAEQRRSLETQRRPSWLRLPLDVGLLAASAAAFWLSGSFNTRAGTAGAGETAAVSLGTYAFLGPLLFLRIAYGILSRPPGRWRGGLAGLAGRSLQRRRDRSAAALLVPLALSFGLARPANVTNAPRRGAHARGTRGAQARRGRDARRRWLLASRNVLVGGRVIERGCACR